MKTKDLTFTAIVIALAVVLNLFSSLLPIFKMPQGGSVVLLSTLLIMLVSIKYGTRIGLTVGFIYGLFNFMLAPYFIHPMQLLLDYFFAFMAFGLGGLFLRNSKFSFLKLSFAYFICSTLRFSCSFAAGVIFYREFAPVGQAPELYSFIYNITYILPEYILNTAIFYVPVVKNLFYKYFSKDSLLKRGVQLYEY